MVGCGLSADRVGRGVELEMTKNKPVDRKPCTVACISPSFTPCSKLAAACHTVSFCALRRDLPQYMQCMSTLQQLTVASLLVHFNVGGSDNSSRRATSARLASIRCEGAASAQSNAQHRWKTSCRNTKPFKQHIYTNFSHKIDQMAFRNIFAKTL